VKRLIIEPYKALEKADFYTIRLQNKAICETDEFIQRFLNDLLYQKDLSSIVQWLRKMGEMGTLERFFRPENVAHAIPVDRSNLRLFCIRLSDELIVLGNGGIKTSMKIQDSPDAYPAFRDMIAVGKILRRRRNAREIEVAGRNIEGNLNFEIF
jgi:hypothetical protein